MLPQAPAGGGGCGRRRAGCRCGCRLRLHRGGRLPGAPGSAGRRPGCCVTGVATRGAVALAAADPAAADSTTRVTGTSMTFSTSAPTATGTAVTDGPYK